MASTQTEVVIVGSGAAGSTVAAALGEGGKDAVVLEAGPERPNADLISSQLWARRLKWSGPPVVEAGENPIGYVFNSASGVGGTAMHHYAVWPRMHPEDFRCRTRYDRALDWPLGYDDLRPWYDSVQRDVGIAGDAEQEIWRPQGEPYPMPPVPLFRQGEILAGGFEAAGHKTAPLPLAVTTEPYNGREVCIWDGWCDSGCPIGALGNPRVTYLPRAEAAGVKVQANSTVTRILTSPYGARATGVEYVTPDGARDTLMADVVVLAAFTVQNARLLLASSSDRHPDGLANSSGSVGKYIMTHPAGLIYGLFDEKTECYMGAFGGQLVSQDGYAKATHEEAGAFGSYQWMIAQAVKPNDLLGIATTRADLFGSDLHAFMKSAAHGFAGMTAVVEDFPVAENRLTLSDRTDDNGVPLAHVTHTTHPESKALWTAVLEEGKRIFTAAGAKETWTGPQGSMHTMGGTIMGDDSQSSVTNGFGQTHDVPNLLVAGPGLFPTSAGVNPTFTVQALALRSAAHLLENWGSIAERASA